MPVLARCDVCDQQSPASEWEVKREYDDQGNLDVEVWTCPRCGATFGHPPNA